MPPRTPMSPWFYNDAAPNRDAARHVATNALPRMPPTYGTLWFLQRRGTPRRYVLREPELIDLNHFTLE